MDLSTKSLALLPALSRHPQASFYQSSFINTIDTSLSALLRLGFHLDF